MFANRPRVQVYSKTLMATALIVLISTLLFWYWLKRVHTLIFRPEETVAMLHGDVLWGRRLLIVLRSFFFPSLVSCGN
jgi:hypothetical protein